MTIEDKALLIKEIRNNEINGLMILANIKDTSLYEDISDDKEYNLNNVLLDKINDDKILKKMLIRNEYGILGNFLYKYRDKLDEDIIYEMYKRDFLYISKLIFKYKEDCFKYSYNQEPEFYIQELIWKVDKKIIDRLLNDKEFFINERTLSCWKFASDKLKNDKVYVLDMVNKTKNKENITIYISGMRYVLDQTEQIEKILLYTGDKLKGDKEFINTILCNNDNSIRFFKCFGVASKDYIIECLKNNIGVFKYLNDCYTRNEEFILEVIKFNVKILKYVDIKFRRDKEFMLKAIECTEEAFRYIGKKLKEDEEFIKMVNELKIKNDNKDNEQLSLEF